MYQSEFIQPEFVRLIARANMRNHLREFQLAAARRALSICHKLKPSPANARHFVRVFRALNKLRAAV